MYDQGVGVPQNDDEALKWYLKAANQGNADAQYSLGTHFAVKSKLAEALKWYLKAANQGDADAQYEVGSMYEEGRGVPRDYGEAFKWFRKAAEQGDHNAQWRVGFMYELGEGVLENYAEAAKWYRKAAEQGDGVAQSSLGRMYELGLARIMHDGEELRDGCGKKRAIHVANRRSNELRFGSALRHSRHERRYAASL